MFCFRHDFYTIACYYILWRSCMYMLNVSNFVCDTLLYATHSHNRHIMFLRCFFLYYCCISCSKPVCYDPHSSLINVSCFCLFLLPCGWMISYIYKYYSVNIIKYSTGKYPNKCVLLKVSFITARNIVQYH